MRLRTSAVHSKVRRVFREYNRKYFDGKISPRTKLATVHNWPALHWGRCEHYTNGTFRILLNKKLYANNMQMRWTLLHEMAHIVTMKERDDHGPKWKARMRRLARQGAFDDIW